MPGPKTVILSAASCLCILLLFALPVYHHWFDERIGPKFERMGQEWHNTSPEQRLSDRFGNTYSACQLIRHDLEQRHAADRAVVLLPPQKYLNQCGVDFQVPEPVVFYYFTGIRAVWANSSDATSADWVVTADKNSLHLGFVPDKQKLQLIIDHFKKYPIAL